MRANGKAEPRRKAGRLQAQKLTRRTCERCGRDTAVTTRGRMVAHYSPTAGRFCSGSYTRHGERE